MRKVVGRWIKGYLEFIIFFGDSLCGVEAILLRVERKIRIFL